MTKPRTSDLPDGLAQDEAACGLSDIGTFYLKVAYFSQKRACKAAKFIYTYGLSRV